MFRGMKRTNSIFPRPCRRCRIVKPESEFSSYPQDGQRYHRSFCRVCMREYDKKRIHPTYSSLSEHAQNLRRIATTKARRKAKASGICVTCYANPSVAGKINCPSCVVKKSAQSFDYSQRLKKDTFEHYGGIRCACECNCEVTELEFLTLDHIGGRKRFGHRQGFGGKVLYQWVKTNEYPDGFRVLCMSCNFAIGHAGYCPKARTLALVASI